jgi:hypothetical protein
LLERSQEGDGQRNGMPIKKDYTKRGHQFTRREWYLLGGLKISRGRSSPVEVHSLEDHVERNAATVRKSKDEQGARVC